MNAQQSAAAGAMAKTSSTTPAPVAVRAQQACPTCQGIADVMGPGCPMCANCMRIANDTNPNLGT